MWIRQAGLSGDIWRWAFGAWSWFSCASCWNKTNEMSICVNCTLEHSEFWEIKLPDKYLKLIGDIKEDSRGLSEWNYAIWYIWDFTTPASQWNKEFTAPVEIIEIIWLQWNFQRLEIKFWTWYIKVDTNWKVIRNYRSKKATKNRRGKWCKWVVKQPADAIKCFLEDKLSAKFA
jgi:hypothetical protein